MDYKNVSVDVNDIQQNIIIITISKSWDSDNNY